MSSNFWKILLSGSCCKSNKDNPKYEKGVDHLTEFYRNLVKPETESKKGADKVVGFYRSL